MEVQTVETVKTGMEGVTGALTTSFTSIASSCTEMIGSVLPIALPVVGAFLIVKIGIKIFRSVTGKA